MPRAFSVETDLDESLMRIAVILVETRALQGALLRAFERALGARKAGSDE
jgi:hypothetical protein